jgi:hypothetical protein
MDKSMKLFNSMIDNISKKRKAIAKESIKQYKKREKLEKNKSDKT